MKLYGLTDENNRKRRVANVWEEARRRFFAKEELLRLRQKLPNNWYGLVDYDFAHNGDGMKCKEVSPCPFCEGNGMMPFNDSGEIKERNCPKCNGKKTVWYKWGIFSPGIDGKGE